MNYFELYPGDYLRDTGELSLLEHGAYFLLISSYYSTEDGLPSNKDGLFRITRAMKRDEQAATLAVAKRFFKLADDGRLRSERVDEDIARAKARIDAARANGSKGGRPRKEKGNPEITQEKPTGFPLGSDPLNPGGKLNGTLEKAHHTPDPNISVGSTEASTQGTTGQPTPVGRVCLLARRAGCARTRPHDPNLYAAMDEGVSDDAIVETIAEGVGLGKTDPWAWGIATARSRHAAGPSPVAQGPPAQPGRLAPQSRTLQALQNLDQVTAHVQRMDPPRPEDGPATVALPGA